MNPGIELRLSKAAGVRVSPTAARSLQRVASATARIWRVEGYVDLRLCGEPEIARLNRQHMGKLGSTDVLSFPAAPVPVPEGVAPFLGDVVLCWDFVARQAAADGVSAHHAAAVLLVHALAHLFEHDHARPREALAMLRVEQLALRAAGLADVPRPYTRGLRGARPVSTGRGAP